MSDETTTPAPKAKAEKAAPKAKNEYGLNFRALNLGDDEFVAVHSKPTTRDLASDGHPTSILSVDRWWDVFLKKLVDAGSTVIALFKNDGSEPSAAEIKSATERLEAQRREATERRHGSAAFEDLKRALGKV